MTELAEVHARIEVLEREIAKRRAALGKKPSPLPASAIAGMGVLFLFTALGGVVVAKKRAAAEHELEVEAIVLKAPPAGYGVAPTPVAGPITAKIDDDSIEELVTTFERPDETIEIAALSGVTGEPLWRRPTAMRTSPAMRIAKADGRVLVSDGDSVHGFDLKSGNPNGTWRLKGQVNELCGLDNESGFAIFGTASGERRLLAKDILRDGSEILPIWKCDRRGDTPSCESSTLRPCMVSGTPSTLGTKLRTVKFAFEDESTKAMVGFGPQDEPFYGSVRHDGATVFEGVMTRTIEERAWWAALSAGVLAVAVKTPEGPWKIVAEGAHRWSMEVGNEATMLRAFKGTADRFYFALDDRLVVLDPATGAVIHRIASIPTVGR